MESRVKLLASTLNPVGSCIDSLIHTCNSLLYFSQEKQKKLAGVNTINEKLLTPGNHCVVPSFAFGGCGEEGCGGSARYRYGECSKTFRCITECAMPQEKVPNKFRIASNDDRYVEKVRVI